MQSIFWYDLETFGTDNRVDRIAQFAGIRTDYAMRPIADPVVEYCQPIPDYLPDPQACAVHGITPQQASELGAPEPQFAARILDQLCKAQTCVAGYNNLRFDDEFLRFLFYRNFFDPFEREYKDGNSRFDLIDVVRMAYALRPEGIEWPLREDGAPSFRLEDLAAANGIAHTSAHDALSDVEATIGLARRMHEKQPRLLDYALSLRDKRFAASQLNLVAGEPVVHVSSKFAADRGCLAVVSAICPHPGNGNAVIVYDLATDPSDWIDLDPEQIAARVFSNAEELDAPRIPLKSVQLNRCPMLAPLGVLRGIDHERIDLNLEANLAHHRRLRSATGVTERVSAVFAPRQHDQPEDAERALYSGGFLSNQDRALLSDIRSAPPERILATAGKAIDPRLSELGRRRLARFHHELLSDDQRKAWCEATRQRLQPILDARHVLLQEIQCADIRQALMAWYDERLSQFGLRMPGSA